MLLIVEDYEVVTIICDGFRSNRRPASPFPHIMFFRDAGHFLSQLGNTW